MMVKISMIIYFHKVRFPCPTLIFPHQQTPKGSLKVKVKNQITITSEVNFVFFSIFI